MGFLAWLRKIQYALHKCAESIHQNEERKRDKQLPPDKPIEVRAIVSFDEKTAADTKAENDRAHTTQESIKNAAWAAFVAVTIYALVTSLQWCEMRKTTKAAQDQLALLRDADRPWVKASVAVTSPLTYDLEGMHIGFTFTLKNVGKSPAENVSIAPHLVTAFMGDDLRQIQKRICENHASANQEWLRYVLFPDDPLPEQVQMQMSPADVDSHWNKFELSQGPIDLIPVALVGCVDYTYGSSPRHHQTGFALDVATRDGGMPVKSRTPIAIVDLFLREHARGGHFAN